MISNSPEVVASNSERRFDLDWLRIIAFALLILYHVGMLYVTWDFHIKSPRVSDGLEPYMLLTSPWRLTLLFVVSGAATHFVMQRRDGGQFASERSKRLLWPLLFAMLVVVPPQSYYEILQKGFTLDYLDFWNRYLRADRSFCRDGKCLSLPTWNHMWFVAYLWVYTMLLATVWFVARRLTARVAEVNATWFAGWRVLILPVLYLALARLTLLTAFPSTHNLRVDWYNHAVYLPAFLFGLLCLHKVSIRETINALRWRSLALAVASYAALICYFTYYEVVAPPDWLRLLLRLVWALNQWSAILAALGFAHVLLNRDGPARRYLNSAIFPLYLFHQTAIIVIAWQLMPLQLPLIAEGVLLVVLTVVSSLTLYEFGRRIPYLRVLIGARHQ